MSYEANQATQVSIKPLILSQVDEITSRLNHLAENVQVIDSRLAKVCHTAVPGGDKTQARQQLDVDLANNLLTILDRIDGLIGTTDSILSRLEI